MKIFYDKISGKEIIDVSGLKTLIEIKLDFGDSDYEEKTFQSGEGHRIKNGKIETYNIQEETDQKTQAKEAEKVLALSKIKTKLSLTDADIQDLKTVLG